MAVKSYWANESEKQEIIEFIDYVFSKAHRPHDFASLLPKLYGKSSDGAAHHFVIREDGKLAATVLAYPVMMQIGESRLMTLGVGSVSTHPCARGKGYMKLLMDAVDDRARETGAAFAVLGGLRQRYGYFGYEQGGYQMNALLTKTNVRHALAKTEDVDIAVEAMREGGVRLCKALQERQPCFCARGEAAFADVLRSWNNEPFVVSRGGEFAGFGTLRRNPDRCHIAELLLENEADFPTVMKRLSMLHGDLSIAAAPWERSRAAWLSAVAEKFEISANHLYKIYEPDAVRDACAQLGLPGVGFAFDGFSLPLPLYIAPPDAV